MSRSDSLENKKSNPSLSEWFSNSHAQWFLSIDDKDPILSKDGWFNNFVGVVKKTAKVIFERRIGFDKIKIVIAKNHNFKEQYYELRERLYRKKLGFKNYDGHETLYDQTGDVIVALYMGKVIAGARLDFSNKHQDVMYNDNYELNGFTYKDLAKKLDSNFKEGEVFAEICGVAVSEKVKSDFYEKFFTVILTHSLNKKASYLFGIVYPHSLEVYNTVFQRLYLHLVIFRDLKFNIRGSYGQSKSALEFFPLGTVLKGVNL